MTVVTPSTAPRRGRRVLAVIVAGALLLAGGFAAGRLTAVKDPAPSNTSAEAGFARDMQTHHLQAVEMAMIEHGRTDDADLSTLSYDIATSQANQAGQMMAWLNLWNLPQTGAEPEMTWMTRPTLDGASGHAHSDEAGESAHTAGDPMPGYATAAQITSLQDATGVEADRVFLELMIAHHQGGVEMAEAVLDRTSDSNVTSLANGIVFAQQGEIDYMEQLLEALPATG